MAPGCANTPEAGSQPIEKVSTMTTDHRITQPRRQPSTHRQDPRLSESERWLIRNIRRLDDDALLRLLVALRPGARVEAHHA